MNVCAKHGRVAGIYTVQSGRIRVGCEVCGRRIKWAAHTPENWARAGVAAPEPAQLWTSTRVETEDGLRARLASHLRALHAPATVVELVDLLLLVGWERALRVTTNAALQRAAEMGCPPEYVASLHRERDTWVDAEVEPLARGVPAAAPTQARLL